MTDTDPETWEGVELRHLTAFVAVAERGSFRRAAAELGYVQSAVSQQIARLESATGTPLVVRSRGNRDLRLTAAGCALLIHARRVVEQLRAACADVGMLDRDGPLRLAVEPASASLVPAYVRALAGPSLDRGLCVLELPPGEQPELVLDGTVDLAIGSFAELPPRLSRRAVARGRWVLVGAPDMPLCGKRELKSLTELRDARLIVDGSHPLPPIVRSRGVAYMIRCDRLAVALEFVRARSGYAIVPDTALGEGTHDLAVVDLGELLPAREVAVIWLAARRLPRLIAALDLEHAAAPLRRRGGELAAVA